MGGGMPKLPPAPVWPPPNPAPVRPPSGPPLGLPLTPAHPIERANIRQHHIKTNLTDLFIMAVCSFDHSINDGLAPENEIDLPVLRIRENRARFGAGDRFRRSARVVVV